MTKQIINIGTYPNDHTGDPIRDAFDKVNDNFNEVYEASNITPLYAYANATFFTTGNGAASFTQANTARIIAGMAFDAANSAGQTIIGEVYDQANTGYNKANAAYDHANAAYAAANNINTNLVPAYEHANVVGISANAYSDTVGLVSNAHADMASVASNGYAIIVAAAANGWANTVSVPPYDQANLAYYQANIARTTANLAWDTANAASGGAATGAYDRANLSITIANDAYIMANAAYEAANIAFILANSSNLYDVGGFVAGTSSDAEKIFQFSVVRPFTLNTDLTGSVGKAGTAATTNTVFTIYKNVSNVGTMIFSANSETATFNSNGSSISLTIGDYLRVIAPTPADATLADFSFTFKGVTD